jgi:glycosyltransferase involved in cell wall biosynthesis
VKFLWVAELAPERSSGAAGAILSLGDALAHLGHEVEYVWASNQPRRLPHATLTRLFELPRIQLHRVAERLATTPSDVVIVSQPYAYLVYERLPRVHPRTLFLNYTHGWERHHDLARQRFTWDAKGSLAHRALAAASRAIMARICARTARACHGLIAPGSVCIRFIRETYGLTPDRAVAIPHGVDPRLASVVRPGVARGSPLSMLFMAGWLPLKGSRIIERVLTELVPRHPGATATFVVDPPSVERVRATFAPVFGERLTVRGRVPWEEALRLYTAHDVLLHPSYFEGFGRAPLEAMACGTCPIVSNVGGTPDLLPGGHGPGLVFAAGDEPAFRAHVERCLTDPDMPRELGRGGPAVARAYTWERAAKSIAAFATSLRERLLGGAEAA